MFRNDYCKTRAKRFAEIFRLRTLKNITQNNAPRSWEVSDSYQDVDFLMSRLHSEEIGLDAVIREDRGEYWICDQLADGEYCNSLCIKKNLAGELQIEIKRFFGPITISYSSAWDFFISSLLLHHWRVYAIHFINNTWKVRTIRFAYKEEDLLNKIVTLAESEQPHLGLRSDFASDGKERVWLFIELYGFEAFSHPRSDHHYFVYELLLNSLVRKEALSIIDSKINLGPNAIGVLNELSKDRRRHRDDSIRNFLMLAATIGIAIFTGIQAFS